TAKDSTTQRELRVRCERADHVYLQLRAGGAATRVLLMQPDAARPGDWRLRLQLGPGQYTVRVYCETNGQLTWCMAPTPVVGDGQHNTRNADHKTGHIGLKAIVSLIPNGLRCVA